MFGLFTRSSNFEQHVRRLVAHCGFAIIEIDADSAFLQHTVRCPDYVLGIATLPDGTVLVQSSTLTKWDGRVPAAAHVLMEDFDKKSPRVSFAVSTNDEGRTRCWARTRVTNLTALTPDAFGDLAAEILAKMSVADQLFREHGYA